MPIGAHRASQRRPPLLLLRLECEVNPCLIEASRRRTARRTLIRHELRSELLVLPVVRHRSGTRTGEVGVKRVTFLRSTYAVTDVDQRRRRVLIQSVASVLLAAGAPGVSTNNSVAVAL